MATKIALTTLIVRKLAKEVVLKAAAKRLVKFGIGFTASGLLFQGFLERASEARKQLQGFKCGFTVTRRINYD